MLHLLWVLAASLPLPVPLASFSAKYCDGRWRTQVEMASPFRRK